MAPERPGTQDERSPYDRFVEVVQGQVSRSSFFALTSVVVLAWLVSLPAWADLKAWQVAIHTVASVVTLLLLALLENSGRRDAEAAHEKLDVLADALSRLMASQGRTDPELTEAAEALREAVGLEERR